MSLFRYTRAGQTAGARRHSPLLWIALIALILGAVALAFAWLAGWIETASPRSATDTIRARPARPGLPPRAQQGHLRERLVRPVRRPAPCPVHGCSRSAAC